MADETEIEVSEDQQIEEKEDTSFGDDLRAAMEEADKEEGAEEEIETPEGEKPDPGDVTEGEEISAEADTESEDEIDCTTFCRTEEERASFAELSSDMQRVVEQRYKDFEYDYQGKMKENNT